MVALAFHVDYWDRLGWKDRFASAAFTARQAAQQASNGARFSYTPQVVVDGRDRTRLVAASPRRSAPSPGGAGRRARWRATATASSPPSRRRRRAASGSPRTGPSPSRATSRAVKAGENEGATLHHDFVVRDYEPVPAWTARSGAPQTLASTPATADAMARIRASVNLVVVDAATRPAGAGGEDRLLNRVRVSSAARSAARSSAPISGLPANGSVGLRACTMSSSRVCTLPSAFGWL